MGYKASLIIIKRPLREITEIELLDKLGFSSHTFSKEVTLADCMCPNDQSISIGYYNDCIIIADDYQLTDSLERLNNPPALAGYEKILGALFTDSEILTVACHSTVNYHLYSLVLNAHKMRFKRVVSGEPTTEYGTKIEEEEKIYAYSRIVKGERMFRSRYKNDEEYDYTEDQFMEDFTFGVAKRHLGIMISSDNDEELTCETPFRKYKKSNPEQIKQVTYTDQLQPTSRKKHWLWMLFKK